MQDNTGSLFAGAVVTGDFSGTITENGVTGTSGPDGVAVLETSESAKGSITFDFCVVRIDDPDGVLESFVADPIPGAHCVNF